MCTIGWGSLPVWLSFMVHLDFMFSSSVYNYLAGMKINVGEREIGDPIIKMITSEVITAAFDVVYAYTSYK